MSVAERIKGVWGGIKTGVMVPLVLPVAFMNVAGSGAGPAIAVFFCGVAVFIGAIVLAGAVPLAAWLNVFGVPWYITVPATYFIAWGLMGFWWKIKP